MPSLQLHMLRVAAVAKMICDNSSATIDSRVVIIECLFHDMGNIVKSDLTVFPDLVEPEGREYWEVIKKEYVEKYGAEQHAANAALAREVGLPQEVIGVMNKTGFSKVASIAADSSLELKVCQYADMRVGPYGILPMEERLREGRERYTARSDGYSVGLGFTRSTEEFERLMQSAQEIEKQVFAAASISPENITDASAASVIEELWEYPI